MFGNSLENQGKTRDIKKNYVNTKLFVGNLSFDITENDLLDVFAAHGTVTETNLLMDRTTGKPRGFAFITMATPEEAQKAIESLNGSALG